MVMELWRYVDDICLIHDIYYITAYIAKLESIECGGKIDGILRYLCPNEHNDGGLRNGRIIRLIVGKIFHPSRGVRALRASHL